MKLPFISRVVIKNYKSIARCDVKLYPLQFLVGRNGAGKSNFLDALAFVSDALENNLGQAFRNRQSPNEVRRRSGGHPQNFSIALNFNLPSGAKGEFAFEVKAAKGKKFSVKWEKAQLMENNSEKIVSYKTNNGKLLVDNPKQYPPVADDRLYLQSMATFSEYKPLLDALCTMRVYKLNPQNIADFSPSEEETLLKADGANIASCLVVLDDKVKARILDYLRVIVPFVSNFKPQSVLDDSLRTVRFAQEVKGLKTPSWWFNAASMSDGTLRALGILVALLQKQKGDTNNFPLLVGIEEPETALHPLAAASFLDALYEASKTRQVIVATHSMDLLDDEEISPDIILPVIRRDSATIIQRMPKVTADMMREHLTTAGELLRQDQLSLPSSDE